MLPLIVIADSVLGEDDDEKSTSCKTKRYFYVTDIIISNITHFWKIVERSCS
jgi:hypothetical protein